ncbi:MAG: S41 family peptidase [Planctomycetes bacterium]|nr:S41 family peptidase [Planctomycetota bacterium]
MLLAALLLPLLLQDPAAGKLDDLLSAAKDRSPAAVLLVADAFEPPAGDAWELQAVGLLEGADNAGRLALGRLLAQFDNPAGGASVAGLVRIGQDELSQAALSTQALPVFFEHGPAQDALGALLTSMDPEQAPELYAEAAGTLFRIGDGARRRAAKRLLRGALVSPDPGTAEAAALALARSGELEADDVLDQLELMAHGIGHRAILAQALLDQRDQRSRLLRKIDALDEALLNQTSLRGRAKDEGDLRVLLEVMRFIRSRHMEGEKFDDAELMAAAANGMLSALDPHSSYMPGQAYKDFIFDMNPNYGGIGAYVNVLDGVFTITRPIYSGPAYEAGLLTGDRIIEVEGWSTLDQPAAETINRLKGVPGTIVKVKVVRPGWNEPRDVEIERRIIELPSLLTEVLPGDILYLDLLHFAEHSTGQVLAAIEDARRRGPLKGVVLDLRDNPGGYMNEAVSLCDLFLPPDKLIVATRTRSGYREEHRTENPAVVPAEVPLMVLVNRFSASASEIVAGALSYHQRGLAIGERSHGKGSVQNIYSLRIIPDEPWNDEDQNGKLDDWEKYDDLNQNGRHDLSPRVKLTMAYYFLPDGSTIHTQRRKDGTVLEEGGVEPDVVVKEKDLDIQALRELQRLLGEESFQTFAKQVYAADPELSVRLSEADGRDPQAYPGWDEFYAGLATTLDPDEVRRWVRRSLRNEVSDARGKRFAGGGFRGDFQEDVQLQEALRRILQDSGLSSAAVPEYDQVF